MSTTPDPALAHPRPSVIPHVALQSRSGLREIARMGRAFGGFSLTVAGLMLGLLPADGGEAAAMLGKLMVALGLGLAGLALWQSGLPRAAPKLEIDVTKRELRLMRSGHAGNMLVVGRAFAALKGVDIRGRRVRFWDANDSLLAEVMLPNTASLGALKGALASEGVRVRDETLSVTLPVSAVQ